MSSLKFVLGRCGSGKSEYIFNDAINTHAQGKNAIIIVPEQCSHESEFEMIKKTGYICESLYVTSFNRLSSRLIADSGIKRNRMDSSAKAMLLARALSKCRTKLNYFKDAEEKTLGEIYKQVQPEDLLKYGLIPEFVGRLPVITALDDLNEEALVKVLTEPKNALIKQYEILFGMEDVKLSITNDALIAIAKKAIERKTGARGLRAIMEENLLDLMYDIPDKKDITEIVVDAKVINEGKAPTFIRKRHKKSA